MNVPKRCLETQTRPDRLRGEPRQGELFHALTPLAPTHDDFSEISSKELQDQAAFHRCECHAWTPLADECFPKRCLGTQTRPDRLRREPRQGEPFHALTPLAPRLVLTFQKSAAKIRKIGQHFINPNATHGPHSPMNVFLNVVLGHKQDLTDCVENLDKENPSMRLLL